MLLPQMCANSPMRILDVAHRLATLMDFMNLRPRLHQEEVKCILAMPVQQSG